MGRNQEDDAQKLADRLAKDDRDRKARLQEANEQEARIMRQAKDTEIEGDN